MFVYKPCELFIVKKYTRKKNKQPFSVSCLHISQLGGGGRRAEGGKGKEGVEGKGAKRMSKEGSIFGLV